MESKLAKVMIMFVSGAIAVRAVQAIQYYKARQDLHTEIEESATDEK